MTRFVVSTLAIGLMVLGPSVGSGQNYPNKPIRIVVSSVGGSGDIAARLIGQGLTDSWGQQVIVDNRGNLAGEVVSKAPPDGYTLLVDGGGFWIEPLFRSAPYDAVRDFSAIGLVATSPNILVVHPSVAANSVKELIALAKAKPGELNYGSSPVGGSTHLAGELFRSLAGVNIVRVPYKSSGLALTGLLGGEVQVMIPSAPSATPHLKSGKLRALAVTSAQPSALGPGLPTVAATVPGYEATALSGMFAPAKTPAALVNRLNQEVMRILNTADVKEKFLNSGIETGATTSEQFAAMVNPKSPSGAS